MALNNPYALHFDGVDDHALGPQLSTHNTGTVECVIQVLHEHTGAFVGTYSTTTGGSNRQLALAVYPYTQDRFRIHISAVSTNGALLFTAVTSSGFTYGEPHHVAYTSQHGSGKVDLIVDGIIQDMITELGTMTDCFFGRVMQPSDRLQIGAKRDTSGVHSRPFRGIVDEFRLWNYARTLEQIQTNAHRRLTGSETGLVVYYRFDEGTGDVAYDSSKNGYHGEIVGATWIPGEVDLTSTEHLSLFSPLDITLTAKAKSYIGLGVSSLPATNIGSKSMTLNGKLKGLGNYAGAECSFQYYPVDQYQNKALNFNGGGHIRIPYESCLSPETITIEAFIEPSQLSGTQTILSQGYQEFNLSDYNTIIYVDAEKGNDLTGNGTQKFPFQTLTEAIKHHNGPTAFILGEGIYDSVNVNSAEYQEKLAFIGQGRDTTFKIKGTLTTSSGGTPKLLADLYFYNFVWEGNNLGGTNYMGLGRSSWYFYNIVFKNIPNCTYAYFMATQTNCTLSFENCTKVLPSKDFITHSNDAQNGRNVLIKNCYGAWNDLGYRTTEAHLDVVTSIRTNTPSLDENYNILEEGWQNAGTGTNPDGTRAHIGVYGGPYAWSYLISYFLKLADSRVEFGCMTDFTSRLFSQHEISEGETVHVACTYDKIGMKIYINGNLDSFMPKNGNLLALSVPLYVAKNFNGTIDEIRIWNHARTQKEIEEGITQELTGAEEGLIAYYRFNEGEGDTLHDCSANYNDGTIDKALWVDSPFKLMPPKEKLERNKGLSFDGIDDYVQIPKEALVFNNSPRTYSIYFKADKTLQTSMHILAYGKGDIGKAFGLQLAATGILYLNLYGGGNIIQLFQTTWEGWVDLVYDGTTLKVYYNGEKTFGQNININTGLSEYGHLGHRFYHDPHWYKGIISEFRSFNYALSELELAAYRYRQLSGNERGLLGYYKMSEEQDNVLIDYSDNNNHGTIYGATWKDEGLKVLAPSPLQETPPQKIYSPYTLVKTVTPKEVNGLYFDGVNDYVSIPHNAIIKPQHITIMAWVDRDDWSKVGASPACITSCTEGGGYGIACYSDGRIGFALYIGGGYRLAYSSGPISPGLHFICATYDGKSLKLYIDGELDSETPYSGNISYSVNNHVTIGVEPTEGTGVESGSYLSGVISNLSIWNRGLSEEEVSYYYNNELKGNEHGLVAYYKMDEGEGNKIYNSSLYKDEYNLDGTISGATWDIVSLPETKYKYEPGVKFSSIITPGEYKLAPSKGLSFDGVDDYVVNNSFVSPFTGKKEVSVIARVKLQSKSSMPHRILVLNNCFTFGVNYNGDLGGFVYDSSWKGGWSWDNSATVPMNEEATLVFTYDGSLLKGYINGILSAQRSATISGFGGSSLLEIGMSPSNIENPHQLKGEISNLSIWSRVLGQEEILFYQDKQLNGNETGLVSYYKEPFRNKLLLDVANNKNDGFIYGAQEVNCSPLYSLDKEPSGTKYYYRAVAKGLPDYALSFDGENDKVLLSNSFFQNLGDLFSIHFKIKVNTSNKLMYLLSTWGEGKPDRASYDFYINNENKFCFRIYNYNSNPTHSYFYSNAVVPYNKMVSILLIFNKGVATVYVNGEEQDSINGLITPQKTTYVPVLGSYRDGDVDCFSGEFYKVELWNRALTEQEIKNNLTKSLVGNEPGLVAYYRMVEGEGDILIDHSINQNHGTIYGATWKQL